MKLSRNGQAFGASRRTEVPDEGDVRGRVISPNHLPPETARPVPAANDPRLRNAYYADLPLR